MVEIDRAFVRIAEGLIHYRHAGNGVPVPLYMIHASPMSAISLVPIMGVLAETRAVIAPDTLGYGDSAAPTADAPDMDYYADSVARVLDALKLDRVDLYGSHTGAHIACEVALLHPTRVRKLVFDGVGIFSAEDKADFLLKYAPEIAPDEFGRHLVQAWNWTRDGMLYFPHFRHTAEHRRNVDMLPPATLHMMTVELLKSLANYHKGYRAAFGHPDRVRLALLTLPTFCMASTDDILADRVAIAASFMRSCASASLPSENTPEGLRGKAKAVADFLDA